MSDTLIVGSRVDMAIQVTERDPDPEKPGNSPELRSIVLNGSRHPDAINGEGITRGVPADLYRAWVKDNGNHPAVRGELLREMSERDIEAAGQKAAEFGIQPGLEATEKDPKAPEMKSATPRSPGKA